MNGFNTTVVIKSCTCGIEFPVQKIIEYNSMISMDGAEDAGLENAFKILKQMKEEGVTPGINELTLNSRNDVRLCCLLTMRSIGYSYNDAEDNINGITTRKDKYSSDTLIDIVKSSNTTTKSKIFAGSVVKKKTRKLEVPESEMPGVTVLGFHTNPDGSPKTISVGNSHVKILSVKTRWDNR